MFPHPCGAELEAAVAAGADPRTVVPDSFVVVRGGLKPHPPTGEVVSGSVGPDLETAGCAIAHGNMRVTTAGAIRAAGGSIVWEPEITPAGTMNYQHVNVVEMGPTVFSEPQPNPVPRRQRIDA